MKKVNQKGVLCVGISHCDGSLGYRTNRAKRR